ncbi:GNAT family N-acetyltransferase [Pseudoalteromonas sp. SCSIO 43201]|uniref:GNAT family N-acetyltransferase n=1 Tax=Pseudoalteromonas TaxID=53246 RepID=UPI002075C6A4|nr:MULTISPECIES: GNAT family N-acetyltransferase [Pseudoalteromonas]MDW7550681.1 GNAT family N-acetyltransferase [Pseudoalteromonas peptidolytica]USD29904.1 GNAT family N-acetyltransferase [Pseudoalteromonas sp. SCSIO 43201]
MTIRTYTEDDFQSIEEIYNLSKLDELAQEAAEFTLLPLSEDIPRNEQLFESQIFVYELGSIAAFCALCHTEIRALFVHPDHRGKGIGKDLLKYLLSLTSQEASLYVVASNCVAKEVYKSVGFVVTETFETTYNSVAVTVDKMVRNKG